MGGDYSRQTFDLEKAYRRVRMQQGRVQVDADFNEQVDILHHLNRTERVDVIGWAGFPESGGLRLEWVDGELKLYPGRVYAGGLLADYTIPVEGETDGPVNLRLVEGDDTTLDGIYMIYARVWEHEVPAPEDPDIVDPALMVPDTSIRTKVECRVRFEELDPTEVGEDLHPIDRDCVDVLRDELERYKPRLTALTGEPERPTEGVCAIGAESGYRGLENQLYRVEIHRADDDGVTFKWSRDNGSLVYPIDPDAGATPGSYASGDTVEFGLSRTGKDAYRRIDTGDIVEIVSEEYRDADQRPGLLAEVVSAPAAAGESAPGTAGGPGVVELKVLEDGGFDHADEDEQFYLRRWDHAVDAGANGAVALTDGEGPEGLQHEIERGLWLQKEVADAEFRRGDYGMIPARAEMDRTGPGEILWPHETVEEAPTKASGEVEFEPPVGIDYFGAPLGVAEIVEDDIVDFEECRPTFPPLTELRPGTCTVTVGPGGEYETLTRGIREVLDGDDKSGCVCLMPGIIPAGDPITIQDENAIEIHGCSESSVVVDERPVNSEPLVTMRGCRDIECADFTILGAGAPGIFQIGDSDDRTSSDLRFDGVRAIHLAVSRGDLDLAEGASFLRVSGVGEELEMEDCQVFAPSGLALHGDAMRDEGPATGWSGASVSQCDFHVQRWGIVAAGVAGLEIERCRIGGVRRGVELPVEELSVRRVSEKIAQLAPPWSVQRHLGETDMMHRPVGLYLADCIEGTIRETSTAGVMSMLVEYCQRVTIAACRVWATAGLTVHSSSKVDVRDNVIGVESFGIGLFSRGLEVSVRENEIEGGRFGVRLVRARSGTVGYAVLARHLVASSTGDIGGAPTTINDVADIEQTLAVDSLDPTLRSRFEARRGIAAAKLAPPIFGSTTIEGNAFRRSTSGVFVDPDVFIDELEIDSNEALEFSGIGIGVFGQPIGSTDDVSVPIRVQRNHLRGAGTGVLATSVLPGRARIADNLLDVDSWRPSDAANIRRALSALEYGGFDSSAFLWFRFGLTAAVANPNLGADELEDVLMLEESQERWESLEPLMQRGVEAIVAGDDDGAQSPWLWAIGAIAGQAYINAAIWTENHPSRILENDVTHDGRRAAVGYYAFGTRRTTVEDNRVVVPNGRGAVLQQFSVSRKLEGPTENGPYELRSNRFDTESRAVSTPFAGSIERLVIRENEIDVETGPALQCDNVEKLVIAENLARVTGEETNQTLCDVGTVGTARLKENDFGRPRWHSDVVDRLGEVPASCRIESVSDGLYLTDNEIADGVILGELGTEELETSSSWEGIFARDRVNARLLRAMNSNVMLSELLVGDGQPLLRNARFDVSDGDGGAGLSSLVIVDWLAMSGGPVVQVDSNHLGSLVLRTVAFAVAQIESNQIEAGARIEGVKNAMIRGNVIRSGGIDGSSEAGIAADNISAEPVWFTFTSSNTSKKIKRDNLIGV